MAALDLKSTLEQSQSMSGPLGAIAYVVLKGLEAGGADAKLVASARALMQEHFSQLSDADCNVLCDVVFQRLQSARQTGRPWYPNAAR